MCAVLLPFIWLDETIKPGRWHVSPDRSNRAVKAIHLPNAVWQVKEGWWRCRYQG